ncbi:hypothetical protein M9458_041200, partial [Cirrhinus mrigala]
NSVEHNTEAQPSFTCNWPTKTALPSTTQGCATGMNAPSLRERTNGMGPSWKGP